MGAFSVVYGKTSERHCTNASSNLNSNKIGTIHLLRARLFVSSEVVEQ